MDADEMDVDVDGAGETGTPASGPLAAFLSELAALHRRSSSSSVPLSLPSLTLLSSAGISSSLFPRLAAAGLPASSLLPPLTSSLSAHPLSAAVAYLRLLLAPAPPLLSLFSPLPFLSFLLAFRKAASSSAAETHSSGNPNPGSGNANPRKRKNQRQTAAPRTPSFLPEALSLLSLPLVTTESKAATAEDGVVGVQILHPSHLPRLCGPPAPPSREKAPCSRRSRSVTPAPLRGGSLLGDYADTTRTNPLFDRASEASSPTPPPPSPKQPPGTAREIGREERKSRGSGRARSVSVALRLVDGRRREEEEKETNR